MANLKKRTVAIVGVAVGVLTLRAWRKRRSDATETDREDADPETAYGDIETPAEHAAAAVEHARAAGTKAVESVREET